jgi:molecular chaperone GrpE
VKNALDELSGTTSKPEQSATETKPAPQPDKAKELEDRVLRLQAEFENYKKRAARENEVVRESASAELLLKLLPVIDDFDMALMHMDLHKKDDAGKEFMRGMELIYAKLLDTLKKEGVEEMNALGEKFDPYKHDALRHGEGEDGKVVEVVQKGYTLKGKVLRHAKVVVGKGAEAEAKAGKEGKNAGGGSKDGWAQDSGIN